jgi:hypothetical protein
MKWGRIQNGHYRGKSDGGSGTAERGSETGLWAVLRGAPTRAEADTCGCSVGRGRRAGGLVG